MLLKKNITDVDKLFNLLPTAVRKWVEIVVPEQDDIIEVVMDLGRAPQVRFVTDDGYDYLSMDSYSVTNKDITSIVRGAGVSQIHENNRAGLDGTLHRISCIRDLSDNVVGLTLRVGRIINGTTNIIADLIASGRSILLVGRPGRGKTSKLREACRILANDLRKRVVIVDSSNEIAGESVIPHSAVGDARRMMVPRKNEQVRVMVEAVENHMPETVVVDELSLQNEAWAAKTIAERGVQLLATAHGDTLENILTNPPLSILVGGSKSVTLSDDESKRRNTSKIVREREFYPVFDYVVELIDFDTVAVHHDVIEAVDAILRGDTVYPEVRQSNDEGTFDIIQKSYIQKPKTITDPIVSKKPVETVQYSRKSGKKRFRH